MPPGSFPYAGHSDALESCAHTVGHMTTTEQTATSRIKMLRRRVLSLIGRHFRRTVSRKTKFARNLEMPNELASRQRAEQGDMKAGIRIQYPATGKTLGYWRLLSGVSFVVVALVGITGFALPETAFAGENDYSPTITVLVHNCSQASPAILAGAEREAGRIMGEAGLRAVWLECPTGPSTADPKVLCQKAA